METERAVKGVVILNGNLLATKEYGSFSLPGGRIEEGEDIDDALAREGREEVGMELVRTGDKLGEFDFEHNGKRVIGEVYECELAGDDMSIIAGDVNFVSFLPVNEELLEYDFFSLDSVIEEVVSRY